jgi:hypothetical protein
LQRLSDQVPAKRADARRAQHRRWPGKPFAVKETGTRCRRQRAYDSAGKTYDFYQKVYRRNSIDDKVCVDSRPLRVDFDNAQWNGQQTSTATAIANSSKDSRMC